MIGVYKILNTINNKYYIGYSKDINNRFKKHKYSLLNLKHWNLLLQRSFNKYGFDNFEFIILHVYNTIKEAQDKELEYLSNILIRCELFNLHYNNSGGDLLSHHPNKKEICERISKTAKENIKNLSNYEYNIRFKGLHGEKNGMFGKTHTEEAKQKISEAQKLIVGDKRHNYGKKLSKEHRKNLSNSVKLLRIQEKNPFYGKHHTEENKKKMSERMIGNIPVTRKAILINNIEYNSISQASKYLNINLSTISNRVKNIKFENYKYKDEQNNKKIISTKISINNILYNSVLVAINKMNLSKCLIYRRIYSTDEEDKDWFITDIKRDKRISEKGKKIIIDNINYNSIKEASIILNINECTLGNWLKSDKTKYENYNYI